MIGGTNEVIQLFDFLNDLDVVRETMDVYNAMNYAMAYSERRVHINESVDAGEEFDDLSEDELKVMNLCNDGYKDWYFEKVEDILLGGSDGD